MLQQIHQVEVEHEAQHTQAEQEQEQVPVNLKDPFEGEVIVLQVS